MPGSVPDPVPSRPGNVSQNLTNHKFMLSSSQVLLLQECWKDLFLLHLCQWSVAWDIGHLLTARGAGLSPGTDREIRTILEIMNRYSNTH